MATATPIETHHFHPKDIFFFPRIHPTKAAPAFPHLRHLPRKSFRTCMAMADERSPDPEVKEVVFLPCPDPKKAANRIPSRSSERYGRKKAERLTYLVAAIMSTSGIGWLAVMSVYYRFSWQLHGGDVPFLEMFGTFALSVGAAVRRNLVVN